MCVVSFPSFLLGIFPIFSYTNCVQVVRIVFFVLCILVSFLVAVACKQENRILSSSLVVSFFWGGGGWGEGVHL